MFRKIRECYDSFFPVEEQETRDLQTLAFALWYQDYLCDLEIDHSEKELARLHIKWTTEFLPGRDSDHAGDCTKQAFSCLRCEMDHLFQMAEQICEEAIP